MSKASISIDKEFEDTRFNEYEKVMHKHTRSRAMTAAKLRDLDAEVNGGALVQIAKVFGKPIYTRVDHHDPAVARAELAKVRSIIKDVVLGDSSVWPPSTQPRPPQ